MSLAWPSFGALPWAAARSLPHRHAHSDRIDAHHGPAAAGDHHDRHDHHHHDASDIPGSPAHPADHDCFQCQVFKHLARCVLLPPGVPEVPLQSGHPIETLTGVDRAPAVEASLLPPARAPPLRPA